MGGLTVETRRISPSFKVRLSKGQPSFKESGSVNLQTSPPEARLRMTGSDTVALASSFDPSTA